MSLLSSLTCACVIIFAVPFVSAQVALHQYRELTLGDPLDAVLARLQIPRTDIKTLHDAPAAAQRATWRPRPYISGASRDGESVTEIMVTFYAGRLAEITVVYARESTQGLTDTDLREAMADIYGPSLLLTTPVRPTAQLIVGRWEDSEAQVMLWREVFPTRVGLTITSLAIDAALDQAIADGMRLEIEGAPARELAKRAAEAEAIRARDEKIRLENKAKFKP